MKKLIILALSISMLASAVSCAGSSGSSSDTSTAASSSAAESSAPASDSAEATEASTSKKLPAPAPLKNNMSDYERSCVKKHGLTLLDEPQPDAHTVKIEVQEFPADEILQNIEDDRELYPDDAYQFNIDSVKANTNAEGIYSYINRAFVDGEQIYGVLPDYSYKGGEIAFINAEDNENGEQTLKLEKFKDLDEFCDYEWNEMQKYNGGNVTQSNYSIKKLRLVYDAVINGTYEKIPYGALPEQGWEHPLTVDVFDDHRKEWEFDRDAVAAIKDSIEEIEMYDAELGVNFLVHVVLPPDYDKDRTYPVLLLTDAVWRFGNTPQLRKLMENGEAEDVILITLGYNYKIDGSGDYTRFHDLLLERSRTIDFITDNLMPYLSENYRIDYENSTFYGHSNGGVLAHTALCKSDQYENQPFGRYIIGSPAFWGLYDDSDGHFDLKPENCENDYDYFSRNQRLNKKVYLCGGEKEDMDYNTMYNGHDSTLEGLKHLKERLESHNASVKYKLYDSHHYQYIPEMLEEYLKTEYPPQK